MTSSVVGRGATSSGEERAFLWTAAGGMVDLGTLGGTGSRSQAEGINDARQVGVGMYRVDIIISGRVVGSASFSVR